MPVWPISCRFIRTIWNQHSNLVKLVRATKNTHTSKYGKNKPKSGYQEILDRNILYIIIEKIVKPSPSPWIEAMCMFKPLIWNLWAITIWKQMHYNKRKTLQKQCNQKTDAKNKKKYFISNHNLKTDVSKCCPDNLVLANRYLNKWKTYQKEIKKSHISHKLGKEGHVKVHNHMLTHVNGAVTVELKPWNLREFKKMERNWNKQNTANFPSNVTHLPRWRIVRKFFQSFSFHQTQMED